MVNESDSHTSQSLLERVRVGDREAWAEFYRRYTSRVRERFICRGMRDAVAVELTHDLLTRLLQKNLGNYNPEKGKLRAYLATCVRNEVSDVFRDRKTKAIGTGDPVVHEQLEAVAKVDEAVALSLIDEEILIQFVEHVRNQVGHDSWRAFLKCDLKGNDANVVAEEHEVSLNYLRVKLHRVRVALRKARDHFGFGRDDLLLILRNLQDRADDNE